MKKSFIKQSHLFYSIHAMSILMLFLIVSCRSFSGTQAELDSAKEAHPDNNSSVTLNLQDDGYRGIWYSIKFASDNEYVYKYGGGLGTYPANHYPFSVYAPEVDKTFFCYGGTDKEGETLLHEVSFYDHKTGTVPRPTIVLDKKTDDAHDNPVINIDGDGYIWIFSTSHGSGPTSHIHKSTRPYDISHFEKVNATKIKDGQEVPLNNFSYLQSYHIANEGFLNLFTYYNSGVISGQPDKARRTIGFMTSPDGVKWSEWKDIGAIEEGHYQTSGQSGKKVATSFNFHPITINGSGLDYRSNLYYIETTDFGQNWQTADGENVELPLKNIKNRGLVKDYYSEGLNVYINDLTFDANSNPVILYITSKGPEAGPKNGPRVWYTARWTGGDWEILPVTTSDNNYDMGSLYIDPDSSWRIVAPTTDGPQHYNTGGEMDLWISKNKGKTWKRKAMTRNSEYNHSYPRRPVNVHPEFYAFWADGHGRERSKSNLYFSNMKGEVFVLPPKMNSNFEKPVRIKLFNE